MVENRAKNGENILVVAGCSKSKLKIDPSTPVPAKKLYIGQLFQSALKFAELHHYDFYCLSGKYGLIQGDEKILTYEQKIKNSEEAKNLQKNVCDQSCDGGLFQQYDYILLIMGRDYKLTLGESLNNPKMISIEDPRGLFGYKQIMATLLRKKFENFGSLIDIEKRVLSMDSLNKLLNKSLNKSNNGIPSQCGLDRLMAKLDSGKLEGKQ
jgi:hypothetical protein